MLTENENKILNMLKELGFDKDTIICCIICFNGEDEICEAFIKWLEKNKQATRDDVWGKAIELAV